MAAGQLIEREYLGTLLRPTLLAPDLAEVILTGKQPVDLELVMLMEAVPIGWRQQRCPHPWA